MQTYSGETMAHEARVRAHLARMQHSPTHVPDRRVRRRTEGGSPLQAMAATSSAPGESRNATVARENEITARGSDHEEVGGGGTAVPTFPWLNPGDLFTDTLSSVEGEEHEVHGR